jgi:type IV pilus assembly protein PilV
MSMNKQNKIAALVAPRARRQRGFSLLEVLITILVFAIGMLGLAALQAASVRSNQSANFRTQATALSYMIIDRMRSNSDAVFAGEYLAGLEPGDCNAVPPDSPQAAHDVAAWRQQLACQLPDGQGSISFPGGVDGVVVSVTWDDARWSLIPTPPFELKTQL